MPAQYPTREITAAPPRDAKQPARKGDEIEVLTLRMQNRRARKQPWFLTAVRRHCYLGLAALVSSCATYHPLPLDTAVGDRLGAVVVPVGTLLPGGLKTHTIDPLDGLDATEVAMIAVVNSPDLKVLRAQANVSHAQAFAAGLLPDPVFGYSRDQPSAGQVGTSTAYTRGVSWDFGPLLTYASRQSARRHTDEQLNLAVLWAEWQTVSQSQLLFVRVQRGRELVARLEAEHDAIKALRPRLDAALAAGLLTFDVATTGLAAASDVDRQLTEARTRLATAEHDLRDMLGLAATEPLPLSGDVDVPSTDDATVMAALNESPPRRPDLRALSAGYAAEDSRLRAAILGQFPAVNLGLTQARDNSNISSSGFSLALSLPLFDRNQGAVRIEEATREQLHAEYAQRLLTARSDVARLSDAQRILLDREVTLAPYAKELEATVARAENAYAQGLLEWTVYLALRQSALSASTELIALRETLAETRIGLATLVTGDWPS